jgi:hypothetical protein
MCSIKPLSIFFYNESKLYLCFKRYIIKDEFVNKTYKYIIERFREMSNSA